MATLFVAIVGCGSGSSGSTPPSNEAPPINLVYPQTTISTTVSQAISADTPTVAGLVTTYSVSPGLPFGLSLSASTGAITGTPTTVTAQTIYTITAASSAGATTATVWSIPTNDTLEGSSYRQTVR
jgi:hypothetical protein